MKISRIVMAVDESPRAEDVVEAAAELGRRFGAVVHPLRVIDVPPEFPAAAAGNPPDQLTARMVDSARAGVDELLARVSPAGSFEPTLVREGVPWVTITAVADELEADLVVMGSHGYHGWDRILGTTTLNVVKRSSLNVFVVHRREPVP